MREIREDNCYYADKTHLVLKLIEEGKAYFLSRPRRFGKSLFLDTLKKPFEGNERLFKGLYCHERWDWQKKYPVIKLSFGGGVLKSRVELDHQMLALLRENRERLGLACGGTVYPAGCLAELLQRAHEK